MGQHPEAAGVQEAGCGALANLALDAALCGAIGSAGGIEVVVHARDGFPSSEYVQLTADRALQRLQQQEEQTFLGSLSLSLIHI